MANCAKHPENKAVGFCTKCGAAMCEECLQKIAGRPVCGECIAKNQLASNAKKNSWATPERPEWRTPEAAKGRPYDFLFGKEVRRIVARIIDTGAVFVVALIPAMSLRELTKMVFHDVSGIGINLSLYLSVLIISMVYFIVMHWRWGATGGKMLMKLKVVSKADHGPVSPLQAAWRWTGFMAAAIWAYIGYWLATKILGWVSFLQGQAPPWLTAGAWLGASILVVVCSLGLLITFVGKYKRGFHDLLGSTEVINRPANEGRKTSGG